MAKKGETQNSKTAVKAARKQAAIAAKRRESIRFALMVGAVVVAAVLLIGWSIWSRQQVGREFDRLVAQGEAALERVESFPDEGRGHLKPGETYNYDNDPPTSGPHDEVAVRPGVYTSSQPLPKLVHSLEHGNIVIYYDSPDSQVLKQLKLWAGRYAGPLDGLVLVPKAGLGKTVILTAWTKMLRLEEWDAAAAAAFIDAFRGRGPEQRVR